MGVFMECKNCGSKLEEDYKFCSNCGFKVCNRFFCLGSKWKKVVFFVSLFFFIFVMFLSIYFYYRSPKKIITSVINGVYDRFDGFISSFDFSSDVFFNGDISFDTNILRLSDLNSEKFFYSFGLDYVNKRIEVGTSLYENDVRLFDFFINFLGSQGFVSLGDDFSSLIKIDDDYVNSHWLFDRFSCISRSDIRYVLKSYKDILIDSLDMSDFSRSNSKIIVNGDEYSVNKLSYEYSLESYNRLVLNIIDNTLRDKVLLDTFSRISGIEVDSLRFNLEESKKSILNNCYDGNLIINIYTKGFSNRFLGIDFDFGDFSICVRNNSGNVSIEVYDDMKILGVVVSGKDGFFNIDFDTIFEINGSISSVVSDNQGNINVLINYYDNVFNIYNNYIIGNTFMSDIDVSSFKNYSDLSSDELTYLSDLYKSRFNGSKFFGILNDFHKFKRISSSDDKFFIEY